MTSRTERALLRASWWAMTLLALGVTGYASMALWNPDAIAFIADREGVLRSTLILHGVVGALALALGPFQFIQSLRDRRLGWHRISGRVYLGCILVGGVTGLWLAFSTPGGLPAQSGFFTMATLWLLTGALALRAVLRGDLVAHRAWMMRCYALTYGAVTLRIYLGLGIALAGFSFDAVYGMAAWASWSLNLLFVEWVLVRRGVLSADASSGAERVVGVRPTARARQPESRAGSG